MDFQNKSEILKALGHPARLKIVIGIIEKQECNVHTIAENLMLPQSTISQHLSILRAKGVLEFHKKGVEVCYQVKSALVKEIIQCLKK